MVGEVICIFIFVVILSFFLCGAAIADTGFIELNTSMMRNTYKIEGKGCMGACFFVGKPDESDPKSMYIVLITAAHVLEQMKGEEAIVYFRQKKGDVYVKIPWRIKIRQGNDDLWTKNKSGLDVAAMYIRVPKNIDFGLLSMKMLANDDILAEYEIHPGDEMFCLGFPFGLEGNKAGFPVLRSGKIASFPLVPTRKYNFFLLDFQVYKGNSGGPVYFIDRNRIYAGVMHGAQTIQFIAGLVSQEANAEEVIQSFYTETKQTHPLKIAMIIHASHILETINQLPKAPEGI